MIRKLPNVYSMELASTPIHAARAYISPSVPGLHTDNAPSILAVGNVLY